MNTDALVVVALPDGTPAAFPASELIEARRRAAELGFAPPAAPPSNGGTEPLLDSKALGALLGCDSTTVEAAAKAGRLPSIRIGRLLRFEPAACVAALKVTNGGAFQR